MTSRAATIGVRMCALCGACALVVAASALAQEAHSPDRTPSPSKSEAPSVAPSQGQSAGPSGLDFLQPPPLPDLSFRPPPALPNLGLQPGLVETFGRWLEDGTTKFKSDMQGAQETFDKLGSQTFDAAKGAVIGLPNVMAARERCAPAQNGSFDCQAAAAALCRGKGFQTGKSLDTQSELKCPAKVLLERRTLNEANCPTEIFVTRVMCQ